MGKVKMLSEIFKRGRELLVPPEGYKPLKLGKGERIIVLAPHCDDEVVGCGGTLIKYISQGAKIKIVYMTKSIGQLGEIRKMEALKVWEEYKVEQDFWNYPDGALNDFFEEIVEHLRKIIKEFKPDIIMLPWPIDLHKDHLIVYDIVCKSTENILYSINLFFYENFYPLCANYLVDITNSMNKKSEMLREYQSQKNLHLNEIILFLNRYRASCLRLKKLKCAEAFYVTGL